MEEENSDFLLVPHERIGSVIGKNGSTKREIELKTNTKLKVDSKEGEIEILQKGDSLGHFNAMRIVKAIARGFSPEKAFRLLEEGTIIEIIDLKEIIGKSHGTMTAKKGRVIGSNGKAREEIETDTGANISVYGKTISIIGKEEEIEKAKKAVEMLLGGASHQAVYGSLRRKFENEKFEL
ncbi:MAG: RNA-processing protein [Candidatus Diapherotrites archaeon]|uniref:RNA-processing protein n=1 Tax=Candidatus Iainarchaeum sp. TaxID=3101447 RepID=A0A2D6LPL3_9ARCH|nr:RNA-processing protein [Candidatus Diapherotrites archaeon]|tara:strand:- start:7539 stop:8078 length:540 start_codon:yes stop_codon:yes gene_type:complete